MSKRIVVAMSGGVDSSVAAALLKEQGHEVIGLTMHHWDSNEPGSLHKNSCSSSAVDQAEKIAEQLGIPFHSVNFTADFREKVIAPFCHEYFSGRTPNPCVICNKKIKFGTLLEKALQLGADYLATGHYVTLAEENDHTFIRKGSDLKKDQSYFLFALSQQQLSHCIFPLGELNKQQVRQHAQRFNLQIAEKDESQDICFIPDGDYGSFLEREQGWGKLSGEIVHLSGKVLGQHRGIYHYTIGQRKGLGIGWTEPLYVVGIDAVKKRIIVAEKEHLSQTEMVVKQCCWSMSPPTEPFSANCRIRYRHIEATVTVEPLSGSDVKVTFVQPQTGITPGQAAVFYREDLVIGGGWIQ